MFKEEPFKPVTCTDDQFTMRLTSTGMVNVITMIGTAPNIRFTVSMLMRQACIYIVNSDPSNMPGQHWIVIYIGENVDYFDPLERAPTRIIEHHLSSISSHGYLRMISPVQSQTSRKSGSFVSITLITMLETFQ